MKKIIRNLIRRTLAEELENLDRAIKVQYQISRDLNNLTNRFDKFVTYKGEDERIEKLQEDLNIIRKRLNNNTKGLYARMRHLENDRTKRG